MHKYCQKTSSDVGFGPHLSDHPIIRFCYILTRPPLPDAYEKIERRKLEFNEILEFLQTQYPNCFNKKRKLLAIGIHKELLKLHSDIFSNAKLSRFFAKYCHSTRYKNRLVVGAIRLNLDGGESSKVTESEISHLSKSPNARNNIHKEKP